MLLWFVVFLLSMSWLYSLNIYTDPVPWVGWILTFAAALLAFLGLRGKSPRSLDRRFSFLAVPLVLVCAILPLPYSIGPALLAVGLLSALWFRTARIGRALVFVASVLLLQSLLPGFYGAITSRSPTAGSITPVIYWLLRFLSAPVSSSQNTLFFRTMREVYETQVTWAALGLLPALLLMAGAAVVIYVSSRKVLHRFVRLLVWTVVYATARYGVLLLVFLYLSYFVGYDEEVSKVYIFWNPVWIGLSFVPYVLGLARFLRPEKRGVPVFSFGDFALNARHRISLALVSLGAFLVTASFGFYDPGRAKWGRVLIDERHSEWTVTTRQYDTKWYGAESGYNYYCMAEYLDKHFSVSRNFEIITHELLEKCDVLILKIPTVPFSDEEIDAITQFVLRGGGLFLIGDHTNVFGSSTYLNPVARRFGFRFRYDCLFDIEDIFTQVYERPDIMPHPIIQRMPPFLFAVSCSIEPQSFFPGRVILAGGLKRLDIDYSVSNFYPEVRDRVGMWFGNFHQAVAMHFGRGRVVGFSDSTVYSNFSAFYPGKPEFLLGTVNWLNRKNRFSWLNRAFALASICLFALATYAHPRKGGRNLRYGLILLVVVVGSVSLAIYLFEGLTVRSYRPAEPIKDFTSVLFEQSHCDYDLPLAGFLDEPARAYEIFYQWTLRLGYFPMVVDGVEQGTEKGDLIVFINPVADFSDTELDALEKYVAEGGRMLVADTPHNRSPASSQVLERFGIRFRSKEAVNATPAYEPASQRTWNLGQAFHLEGGTPLLYTEQAFVVSAFATFGKGVVLAVSFSEAFSDANMGFTEGVIPDSDLLNHYRLQFALLKGLAEGTPRETLMRAGEL